MDLEYLISLGKRLKEYLKGGIQWRELDEAVALSAADNPFFTEFMQRRAMEAICENFLEEGALRGWAEGAVSSFRERKARIGVVMAGNIPLVGFHDLLCVLVSGAEPVVKLSSKDRHLMPVLFPTIQYCSAEELVLQKLDALITMGGGQAAAFYSSSSPDIPKLIRGSRFSAAVIAGGESEKDLEALCEDISLYYGLGCRSVTHLFIKQNFDVHAFAKVLSKYGNKIVTPFSHSFFVKNAAIRSIDSIPFTAVEPFILVKTNELFLPVGVVGYSFYNSEEEIESFVRQNKSVIQKIYRNFGIAQRPSLDDYPDGVNTLEFIEKLKF